MLDDVNARLHYCLQVDFLQQNVSKTRLLYKIILFFEIGSHIKYFCN